MEKPDSEMKLNRHVRVQAHRGFSENYPENTLIAFDKALEAGADLIEMDLAITADGHIIVIHDETLDRTTSGTGPVSICTLEQLKQLDAGSWKDPRFAGERVPTLEEALELAEGRGDLNLEIKSTKRDWTHTQIIIKETVRLIQQYGAHDRIVFTSFDIRALRKVRSVDPEMRLLLIDWDVPSSFDGLDLAIQEDLYGWLVLPQYATEERVRKAKDAGLFVNVGAASESQMLAWIDWGVDQLDSDSPPELVAFLECSGFR